MLIQHGSQLHYWCCFDLVPKDTASPAWSDIVKAVRGWVTKRTGPQDELGRRWFFVAGDWKTSDMPRFRVQTTSCIGNGGDTAPEYWAIRFEHPCDDEQFRQWRTDIGVTSLTNGRYRFVLTTTHSLLHGYIGDEPLTPVPSAPGIVLTLLRSVRWQARSGSEALTVQPIPLKVGQGQDFLDRIAGQDRPPIVLVSLDFSTGRPKLDTVRLSQLLSGNATVYAATSSEVDKELEWLLPKHLHCWNGMIRIYQPGAQTAREEDGRRHRYFTAADVDERTAAAVSEIIVRGIVRRGRLQIGKGIATIEDVVSRQREIRLAELRASSHGQPSPEWLRALEEDNNALNEKVKRLAEQNGALETEVLGLDDEKAGLEDRIGLLRYEKEQCHQRAQSAEATVRNLRTQVQAVQTLSKLPESLLEVVELIERLQVGKILFTPRAKKAAGDASITDMGVAWRCLWSMATVLHDFHFGREMDTATIEREFRAKSGFELSLTEGKQTKADKGLMALRKDEWEGIEIDITPHIKWGSKEPKILRVHYHPHHDRKTIIVGHCGDHMDTSGTRKKK